jgi:riboflavin synthase
VAIIPHTRDKTSLGSIAAGALANLEVDLLARYLARLLDTRSPTPTSSDETWIERLERAGLA